MFTEIMALCILVNTNTPHDVMCNFAGHTKSLDITIYRDGWANEKKYDYTYCLYEEDNQREVIEHLSTMLVVSA
ncbi:MAG: hypothetical protein COA44_06035 [Arcobacter sp.]|nr:MAG: hypothetical protein COA44_06035 [Arcobacter sp.]